ncbi:MAG: dTMP kinase [Spirochaetes bacterium]|jgi:dTMP kinase|nr:dTMP kinase [Spirochaetota bacterium]
MKSVRPLFVVFEGIDGSGKTTICEAVFAHYANAGLPVVSLREPSDGTWGRKIRELIQRDAMPGPEEQVQLFIQDRDDDVTTNIRPALESGKMVLLDRYYYSNAAYQGALGLAANHVIDENRRRNFPEPDRVYLVDLEPAEALRRVRARSGASTGRDAFEREDFQALVRAAYLSIVDGRFFILDGHMPAPSIVETVVRDIDSLLKP